MNVSRQHRVPRERDRRFVAVLVIGLPALTAGAVEGACSGQSESGTCGAGTALVNGVCEILDGSPGPDGTMGADAAPSDAGPGSNDASSETGGPFRDASPDATTCPLGTQGAAMVPVQVGTLGSYCIDTTETTNADYAAFLASADAAAGMQPSLCASNASLAPTAGCGAPPYDPVNSPRYPVACVNWCDAVAYCAWAGKRLCAMIPGASPSTLALVQSESSEWGWSCTLGGTTPYPMGHPFDAGVCVEPAPGTPNPTSAPVASDPSCHGLFAPYSEVYDQVGNVGEWLAPLLVDDAGVRSVVAMGSTFRQPTGACSATHANSPYARPTDAFDDIGIRCCADSAAPGP